MANLQAETKMTKEDFLLFQEFLHEKAGMFFAENKQYLVENRLVKRMGELGIKSYRDYFYHVKYDTSLKEFNTLMDLVTTNETSFFRNEPQLISFADEVLPKLIAEKRENRATRSLKVWSAGCSTGEEPYTLAMLISEKVASLAGWNTEIIASDISEEVLGKARKGEYSGLTLRNVSPDILRRYYDQDGDNYRVKASVKSMVRFCHMNLNDPRQLSTQSGFDIIFCRNVMIYFSDEVKKELVRGFYNALRPGGYFYIGHAETLHGISKAFKLAYFKNALVYHKEVADASKAKPTLVSSAAGRSTVGAGTAGAAGGTGRALDLLSKIKQAQAKK